MVATKRALSHPSKAHINFSSFANPHSRSSTTTSQPRKPKTGNTVANSTWRPKTLAKDRLLSWSSPYASRRHSAILQTLPVNPAKKTLTSIADTFAPATKSAYGAGLLYVTHNFVTNTTSPNWIVCLRHTYSSLLS